MVQLKFTDFEAYAKAVAGVDGDIRVIGQDRGGWTLDVLDAGELNAMLGREGAPVLYSGTNHAGRYGAYISLPGSDACMQGQQATDDQFIWYAPGSDVHGYTRRPSRFIGLDLDGTAVVRRAREVAGLFEEHIERTYPVVVGRSEIAPIIGMVTRALAVHRETPAVFDSASVRVAFSGQVIHALLRCLVLHNAGAVRRVRGRPAVPRNEVIRRSVDHIQRSIRGEAALGDLLLSAGTSQRSLSRAFDEVFGMGPQQYYMLERLHVVRKALREAAPGDTVTSICTRFGVWDQGRFAGMYHRTFGLRPSAELAAALGGARSARRTR